MDNIFIGSVSAARNRSFIKNQLSKDYSIFHLQLDITHMIICSQTLPDMNLTHFQYLHLSIEDSPSQDIMEWFSQINEFMKDAIEHRGKVT